MKGRQKGSDNESLDYTGKGSPSPGLEQLMVGSVVCQTYFATGRD